MNETNVTNTEKIRKQFLEKAVTRRDVYARQTGNGAYYPVHEPLTQDVYLDDEITAGFYNLDRENLCTAGCIDIDVNKDPMKDGLTDELRDLLKKQTLQINQIFKSHDINTILEFSGRKGYHVWIIFESPIQAGLLRQWLKSLAKEFVKVDERLHWEIFPKQDKVDEGQFGNLVKLPLQIHRVSGEWSHFVDEEFNEIIPDELPLTPVDLLQDLTEEKHSSTKAKPYVKSEEAESPSAPPFNMERMEDSCDVIKSLHEKAEQGENITHDERVWLAKVYKPYGDKGVQAIHQIFSQLDNYDEQVTNYQLSTINAKMAKCDMWCKNRRCPAAKAAGFDFPISFGYQSDPGSIELKRGRYVKSVPLKDDKWTTKILSEFIIEPHELIHLESGDVLHCSVVTTSGTRHDHVDLEADAFQSKAKLLKAIGRMDATFHGIDADVQSLAHFLSQRVLKRSRGINHVGLHGDTFVAEGINITREEISYDPLIKVVMRGGHSMAKRVDLSGKISDASYEELLKGMYHHLPLINSPEIIYPFIGWLMLVPLKKRIIKLRGGFFILLIYGEQGSGKTSTAELGHTIYGYVDSTVHDCRMTNFAMLSLLSSTNGLPVVLDEYKETDMPSWQAQQIKDRLRGLYRGSLEPRGHANQTVTNYKLQAPVALSGEYKISEPAIQERAIFAAFNSDLKKDESASSRDHFQALKQLDLKLFAPRYIQWALGQDLDKYFTNAEDYLSENEFIDQIAPRVKENWLALYVGLSLWQGYGESYGIAVPRIPFEESFKKQAEELGLSKDSKPLRDVDRMVEFMAILAEKYIITSGKEWGISEGHALISVKSMLAALRKYKRETNSDFYIMDEWSFRSQIQTSNYYIPNNNKRAKVDGHQKRWIWLDLMKMEDAGMEVDGFRIEFSESDLPEAKTKDEPEGPENDTKVDTVDRQLTLDS